MSDYPTDDGESSNIESSRVPARTSISKRTTVSKLTFSKLTFAAVSLLAMFICFALYYPSPQVALGVLSASKDAETDDDYNRGGEVSSKTPFAATASSLQTKCNVTKASSTTQGAGGRFFGRTIAIYNHNDDLLMKRVGLEVFQSLQDQGRFDQLHYVPAGERLTDGELLPEVYVTLNMNAWNESWLPLSKSYKGDLVVHVGNEYHASKFGVSSERTPPQLGLVMRMSLEFDATQMGFETSGAEYQTLSRDLAKRVVEHLGDLVDEMENKYGSVVAIPDEFYPAYLPPPDFDFIEAFHAEKLVDGRQFMLPTKTVWCINNCESSEAVCEAVRRSIVDAGWKEGGGNMEKDYLRATRGDEILECFRQEENRDPYSLDSPGPSNMFLIYTRQMPERSVEEAFSQLFESDADETTMLMFQAKWHQYPELIDEYFRRHPPRQSGSWMQLATLQAKSNPESAKRALLNASALLRITTRESPNSSMKKLAEELGMGALPERISEAHISELGFPTLKEPGELEQTIDNSESLIVYLGESDDRQTWVHLSLDHARGSKAKRSLHIKKIELGDRFSSWNEQTLGDPVNIKQQVQSISIGEAESISISCEPNTGEPGYRIKLKRTDRTHKTTNVVSH